MNRILVWVISLLGDMIGNVVDDNHPVSQRQDHKDQDRQRKVAESVHALEDTY